MARPNGRQIIQITTFMFMDIKETLKDINFFKYSKVKENLRQKLLLNKKYNLNIFENDELDMDDLDNVVAAIQAPIYNKESNIKSKINNH